MAKSSTAIQAYLSFEVADPSYASAESTIAELPNFEHYEEPPKVVVAVKASTSCTIVVAAVTEVIHSEWVLSTEPEEQLADISKVNETVVQAHDVMAMMADAEKKMHLVVEQILRDACDGEPFEPTFSVSQRSSSFPS